MGLSKSYVMSQAEGRGQAERYHTVFTLTKVNQNFHQKGYMGGGGGRSKMAHFGVT